jgi:hypothetical protein
MGPTAGALLRRAQCLVRRTAAEHTERDASINPGHRGRRLRGLGLVYLFIACYRYKNGCIGRLGTVLASIYKITCTVVLGLLTRLLNPLREFRLLVLLHSGSQPPHF